MAQYERITHMNSNGAIRTAAIIDERSRCSLAIQTQIQVLQERIINTPSPALRQAWAIAIIELDTVSKIIDNPRRNAA
jgi:hypothetical protein